MTAPTPPSLLAPPARFLLAAVLAVGLLAGAAGAASAASSPAAQNAVGASTLAVSTFVGPSESVSPATRLESHDSQAKTVSATGVAANTAPNVVYRGLAEGENPAAGLVARNPEAGNSVASHVAGARDTQWISTTKSESLAAGKFGQNGYVSIDLNKVGGEVVDVSGGIPGMPSNYMLSRWAMRQQEVLVRGNIPPEAIG